MRLSFAVKSCIKYFSITAFVFGLIIATSAQLKAQIIAMDSFDFQMPDADDAGGFIVSTQEFSVNLTSADIPNVSFLANFTRIDAGVAVFFNGNPQFMTEEGSGETILDLAASTGLLFSTGNDVSELGPTVFDTGLLAAPGDLFDEPGNIEDPFTEIGPAGAPLPRLTVQTDSAGTIFSGVVTSNPIGPVEFFEAAPSPNAVDRGADFSNISNFSSLLQEGTNTIQIVNLNSSGGANLIGDFTVTLAAATSVPEPNSLLGLLTLAGMMSMRRRRA